MSFTAREPALLAPVETLLAAGEPAAARLELERIGKTVGNDAALAHDIAQFYMHLGDPAPAADYYAHAVARAPHCMAYRHDHSTALMALGCMEEAEQAMDRVIEAAPEDHDAWYNRATLRRQSPGHNHVDAIRAQLQRPGLARQGQVPLYYALAKELEDLGEDEASFDAVSRGASARRALLSYRVGNDVAMLQAIARVHTIEMVRAAVPGCDEVAPVFVVGLPRSGTTLVDRILSSHSGIGSRGEGPWFALALTRLAGNVQGKQDLLDRSVCMDPRALGSAYAKAAQVEPGRPVVDKTPSNFLYLGLIARALPKAQIIYVRRGPMDVGYAIYKTLFRTAYPYSYDLDDLGRYWLAFDKLMRHWCEALPAGRMLVVDYEDLVTSPEANIRRMLEHVGVAWEDACLHFERNPLPTLTASAAQVRQPVYTSSVGKWRRHARGLAPLAERLRAAGIEIESEATP